jgi:Ca2+-binding RTX toxin-like protein
MAALRRSNMTVVFVLLFGCLIASMPAQAALERCSGEVVTIFGRDFEDDEDIVGTSGPDVIQGTNDAESIFGDGGNDIICGGGGKDFIDGEAGKDKLLGETGNDTFGGVGLHEDVVVGGSDEDIAKYEKVPSRVFVDLGTELVLSGAGDADVGGRIRGVEIVHGSGLNDKLFGNSKVNGLSGGGGNDLIAGRGGSDNLSGGGDIDELSYADSSKPVKFYNGEVAINGEDRDFLIDTFEIVTGSDFVDKLNGTSSDEQFHGGDGNDVIKGMAGHDALYGDDGSDKIYPGPGDDHVDGGANGPVTDVKNAGDVIMFKGSVVEGGENHFEVFLEPFMDDPYGDATGEGEDTLTALESIRGPDGTGNHTNFLEGDDGPNVIVGGDGRDYLDGLGGNDHLYGQGGADVFDGGAGDDYINTGRDDTQDSGELIDGGEGDDTCDGGAFSVVDCEHGTAEDVS